MNNTEIQELIDVIRNETQPSANTKERIATVLENIKNNSSQSLQNVLDNESYAESSGGGWSYVTLLGSAANKEFNFWIASPDKPNSYNELWMAHNGIVFDRKAQSGIGSGIKVVDDGTLEIFTYDSSSHETKVHFIPPTSASTLNFPAKPSGSYTLATTSDVTAAKPYKVYIANLYQNGTDAPVATVFENTFGQTITWTRAGTGNYLGTISGPPQFGELKTWLQLGGNKQAPNIYYKVSHFNDQYIEVSTQNATTLASVDGALVFTSIEIRVYG